MRHKILVVGAGGIGSWLAFNLYEAEKHNQLKESNIFFADHDTVEPDNLSYQNFELDDVMDYKTESLSARYGFGSISSKIETTAELYTYDCIVSAVDNTQFRKMLFSFAETNPDTYWIDLRSEGRSIAAFCKHKQNTLDVMLETIPEEVENGSCQLAFEKSDGIVQNGNKIVASIGAQYILNYLRKVANPPKFVATF